MYFKRHISPLFPVTQKRKIMLAQEISQNVISDRLTQMLSVL